MESFSEITRTEKSSIGKLYFCGEDFFYVTLKNIPRRKGLITLADKLIEEKRITNDERKMLSEVILQRAPRFKTENLALYFFSPGCKDNRGSILPNIEELYKRVYKNVELKGDPIAMAYLNLLDKNNSFVKKYPHISLFEIEGELYDLSAEFSGIPTIEGFNIATATVSRKSGYFPKKFWFCGIAEHLI